jgi:hypothetical protein
MALARSLYCSKTPGITVIREMSTLRIQGGTMTSTTQRELIDSTSRDIVAQLAPQELPLFQDMSDEYFRNPGKARKLQESSDGMVGFGGVEVALLTPLVLTIAMEVIKFVLEPVKTSLAGFIGDFFKQLMRRFQVDSQVTEKATAAALSPERLKEARDYGLKVARELKLSDVQAAMVVDSMIAKLVIAAG